MAVASMDIWSILIIIGIAQGLFTASILIIKHRNNNSSSQLFFLLMIFLIWLQAEFLAIRWPYDIGIDIFYGTRYGSWLLFGPLFYLFVGSIGQQNEFKVKNLLHFLPFVIFVMIIPLFYGELLGFRQVRYGMLSIFDQFDAQVLPIQYLYSVVFVVQFLHFLCYLLLTNRSIEAYETLLKSNYSDDIFKDTKWLKRLSTYLMLVMFFVAVFLIIFFFTRIYRRHMDYIYVLPMTFLMYAVGYRISGVQWRPTTVLDDTKKYKKSSLKAEQAKVYMGHLQNHMSQERAHLNNELRLQDLSESLDIPVHHLSQVLNHNLDTTFFDYINKLRVASAKVLIKERDNATLLEIAFESGFNNKTSFVNAFKKHEGLTPSNYKRQLSLTEV
jgi:AraC-like DNA-binding protein